MANWDFELIYKMLIEQSKEKLLDIAFNLTQEILLFPDSSPQKQTIIQIIFAIILSKYYGFKIIGITPPNNEWVDLNKQIFKSIILTNKDFYFDKVVLGEEFVIVEIGKKLDILVTIYRNKDVINQHISPNMTSLFDKEEFVNEFNRIFEKIGDLK